jgi:tRNA dimethylallyltransferase
MRVARDTGSHIVSVDSMQVYRGMDIGTAKPSQADQSEVPHHMIDLVEPEHSFSVAEFQSAGVAVLDGALGDGGSVVIVGGSGLHFRSLVDPLQFPPSDPAARSALEGLEPGEQVARLLEADPDAGDHVALDNPRRVVRALEVLQLTGETPSERSRGPAARAVSEYRPRIEFAGVGLDPAGALPVRVAARLDRMLEAGFQQEVDGLADRLGPTAAQAVGYRELMMVTRGLSSPEEGRKRTLDATTALARRQRTYLRRDPRIRWVEWDDDPVAAADRVRVGLEEAGWTL